jgi:transcriptional regulator GlxA family with amidase domain
MPKTDSPTVSSEIRPVRVSLLVLPESMGGPLIGLYEDLNGLPYARSYFDDLPEFRPIVAEMVVPGRTLDVVTYSGLPIHAQKRMSEVTKTDVIIISSLYVGPEGWELGAHPETVSWIQAMHANGALLCSTCTGVFPLAETGLLDGFEATVHWGMTTQFQTCFPRTRLNIRETLVISGSKGDIITGGASASWHDLLLYVVSRFSHPQIASALAKFLLLNWHQDGQAFCAKFAPNRRHGDGAILGVQRWLDTNFAVANPVEEMTRLSGLAERTFKRRFTAATGLAPMNYVQELRVEKGKGLLESTDESVENVSWKIGYEDASYFRALFKRLTGVSPAEYRKKYRVPVALD